MLIARSLLDWCDKTFATALKEDDERKAFMKSFIVDAVEGFIDAAVIWYIPVLISCGVWKAKAEKK